MPSPHAHPFSQDRTIPKQEEPNQPVAGPSTPHHPHHADRLPAQLQSVLSRQLGPEYLSTRAGAGGCKLTYIEGWRVIALANEVFGYDGWSSETKQIEVDFVDQTAEGKFNVGVSATLRITLRGGASHEDVGYGKIENSKSKADALDKCKKEAVTDALKRTLRTFGNLMGNCLYDKTYLNNIKTMQAQKEKFMPSKLYRPEHVAPSTRSSSTPHADAKPLQPPSADGEQEKVPLKPPIARPPPLPHKPAPQSSSSSKPVPPKPAHQLPAKVPPHLPSKPAPQVPSKPSAPQTASKPAPYRPPLAEVQKKGLAPPAPVQNTTPGAAAKRKYHEEVGDNTEGEQSTLEETTLEALPATLSDKYFELDEHDLAELEHAESIDLMLCVSQQQPAGSADDESGLITETSLEPDADASTAGRRPYNHHPRILAPARPAQQTRTTVLAGHLPAIRTVVQSSIRYPAVPMSSVRKPSHLNPQPAPRDLNRPAKKIRAGE